ncbi:hypothetical protein SUGI_0196880 [Cryptomeria japonica]|nr:hypothetical protein SUGI_0196880 [Cryptomeria japonica]
MACFAQPSTNLIFHSLLELWRTKSYSRDSESNLLHKVSFPEVLYKWEKFCGQETQFKMQNSSKKFSMAKHGKDRLNVICSGIRSSDDDGTGRNHQTQDILVEIVKLEVSKVRMSELLDESSKKIENIGLQTQLDFAQLADLTVKMLDTSGSQVLNQLDANADAFRQELNSTNANIEAQSRIFEEFRILASYSRNDGLFFKTLYQAPRVLANQSKMSTLTREGASLSSSITSDDFTRSYKQILYGGISLVFLSFCWSSGSALLSGSYVRAPKLISYGVIMSLLFTQLAYAKVVTGEADAPKEIEDKSE